MRAPVLREASSKVGSVDGTRVGNAEGIALGSSVGTLVGTDVGMGVGYRQFDPMLLPLYTSSYDFVDE